MRDRFPENTVLAFERALASGANGLELDLRLTSDNQLIVFHDETLSAASNGTWFVRRRPWRDYVEWVRVKLGRRELTEERVPLFEWVVPVLKRYPGTSVLIDVKDSNDVEILDKLKEVCVSV